MSREHTSGSGRLLTGVAWAVLLVALWLWGREVTDGPGG
ncbi:class F sortase, partial [Streptomyces sp. NPDC005877]